MSVRPRIVVLDAPFLDIDLEQAVAGRRGWDVNRWDGLNLYFGGVQAVEHRADGAFEAAGDPRRGGSGVVVA